MLLICALVLSSLISASFETLDASGTFANGAEGFGYFLGIFIGGGAVMALNYTLVLLLVGAIVYLFRYAKKRRTTYWRSVFDWKPLAIAVICILVAGVLSAGPFLAGVWAGLNGA